MKKEVNIGDDETTGELWDRLSKIGGELLVETLEQVENGTAPRIKQEGEFSMAPMLTKDMARIDWENKTADEIKNLVRGLNPLMGAYTFLNGKKIKFWKVEVKEYESDSNLKNGTVIKVDEKKGILIKTKSKALKVVEIQGENAKRMPIQDYLRGNKIKEFEIFE